MDDCHYEREHLLSFIHTDNNFSIKYDTALPTCTLVHNTNDTISVIILPYYGYHNIHFFMFIISI